MIAGILKEPAGENRVSLLPEQAAVLIKKNVAVWIEEGAGINAFANDALYTEQNVRSASRKNILANADLLLSINGLLSTEISKIKNSKIL